MLSLEEAIQHCLEVAEDHNKIKKIKAVTEEECQCAEEHRQLAEWLEELQRARILLKATYRLLLKQNDSHYVLNLLSETVFYDDAECDGNCLMEDIKALLEDTK